MEDTAHLEKRISDLESHIAHQDTALQDLSDMTAKQWDIIDALTKKTQRLADSIKSIEDSVGSDSPQEPPPPHY